MLAKLAALSLLFFIPVDGDFLGIFCHLTNSCDCDFKPNIKGLEWDLYKNLYGQHLAQDIVSEEVASFLRNKNPDRPLVLSFHGSSGTGKTLVSSMLGSHLYDNAMDSPYVHQFVPTLHFPLSDHVEQYRAELRRWVEGNLTACARSVFIFDEMEKMPPGVIDILEPFLGPSHVVFQTNYRKAIYVFISTTGGNVINSLALKVRQAGGEREDITLGDLEDSISQAVFNSSGTGFYHSSIIMNKLITRFVPFLPLSRRHIERCARQELCRRGLCHRSDVVQSVGGDMVYTPQGGQHFSITGCKSVFAKINLFL